MFIYFDKTSSPLQPEALLALLITYQSSLGAS
jgi:hypothetical protein